MIQKCGILAAIITATVAAVVPADYWGPFAQTLRMHDGRVYQGFRTSATIFSPCDGKVIKFDPKIDKIFQSEVKCPGPPPPMGSFAAERPKIVTAGLFYLSGWNTRKADVEPIAQSGPYVLADWRQGSSGGQMLLFKSKADLWQVVKSKTGLLSSSDLSTIGVPREMYIKLIPKGGQL